MAQFIRQTSREAPLIEAGSLYPALQRLEHQGLITANWQTSDTGRRGWFTLTTRGREKLAASARLLVSSLLHLMHIDKGFRRHAPSPWI